MSSGFINEILSKLTSKTSMVAINISAASVLEVMEVDKNGMIANYASAPIQYNAYTKEFENISDFEAALKRLYNELSLSLASPAYVSIPTVIIDHETLPYSESSDDIKSMLRSTVEKTYIFRRYDPAISYYVLPNENSMTTMNYCYTALRESEYLKVRDCFSTLGLNIKAIDVSFSSLINGVIATRRINEDIINADGKWNILNITPNSFLFLAMQGKQLISVYEEPLAIKATSEEEIYQQIANSLDLVIDNYPAEQIVVVSQSDDVSAEYLTSIINVDCTKAFIEDNKYRKQLVELGLNITQSMKTKVSLEAVGITTWQSNTDGFKFNFIDAPLAASQGAGVESIFIQVNGKDIELTPQRVQYIAIGLFVLVAVICGIAYACLTSLKEAYSRTNSDLAANISKLQNDLDSKPQVTGMSVMEFLRKNYANNENYKKSYAALAQEIPDMLWVEEFQLADDSDVYIAGRSYRMDDVLNYYDSLKKIGKYPNLKIKVLRISNTPISELLLTPESDMTEETTYEFAFGDPFYVNPTAPVAEDKKGEKSKPGDPTPPMGGLPSPDMIKRDR